MRVIFYIIFIALSFGTNADDSLRIKTDKKELLVHYSEWMSRYKKYLKKLVVIDHPNYEGRKSYVGVSFNKFIQQELRSFSDEDLIIITCTDGYRPVLDAKVFKDGKAILAIREDSPSKRITKDRRWTKVKMENEFVTPGPYYLVWPSQENHKHSWPYQIQSIEVRKKKNFNEFLKIKPKSEVARKGFETFKSKCIKCHSIFYIGPKGKAPDLAYVMGYRTKSYVSNRIRKGRGKMPPFSKAMISDNEVEEVLKYLEEIYSLPKK